MMIDHKYNTGLFPYTRPIHRMQIVPAHRADCEDVLRLFGALHRYNAALDPLFALAEGWQALLREDFQATWNAPDKLWLLVKVGNEPVGLLIAGVHSDSPMFQHRRWVEVEGLYVADTHRKLGIARKLLRRAYDWADSLNLPRVQLYVTASNIRAQSLYEDEGFATSQAIMRKSL